MPKIKPLGKPKVVKKALTKVEKNAIRADRILANEQELIDKHKEKQFNQYVELKVLKGHPQELAEKMAKEIIYNTQEV